MLVHLQRAPILVFLEASPQRRVVERVTLVGCLPPSTNTRDCSKADCAATWLGRPADTV